MSYAIVRNEKLTRSQSIGIYNHNERKTKNHSNKNIDSTKTHLNYYIKENELSYVKEFDRIKEQYNLKGQIKVTSNILCEMVFTSDNEFFDEIGLEETKRYFEESYKFACKYKNLGSQNIVSAIVHLDEETPHMHLIYIPVIHTKNKQGNNIDKISCRDFWKGKNSYRDLQDKFYDYISSKEFKLERGQAVEITGNEHLSIEEYKKITNYENTKKVIKNIKVEIPDTPTLKDIKKVMLNRDEKIEQEIIQPKDELINKLYKDNINLQRELSKQVNLVSKAETYQRENMSLVKENQKLSTDYEILEQRFKIKTSTMERKISSLEKSLNFITNKLEFLKLTFKTFLTWIVDKLSNETENSLIKQFRRDKNIEVDIYKELNTKNSQLEKSNYEMEL